MYTIDIHHKGDPKPTTYAILKKEEADNKKLPYKHWREADEGEYGLSDDDYVAKVISKSVYNLLVCMFVIPTVTLFITLIIVLLSLKRLVGSLIRPLVERLTGKSCPMAER